jgi:hypothetical protein
VQSALTKLLSFASEPIGNLLSVDEAVRSFAKWGTLGEELAETLSKRNGFYMFESALLFRPFRHESTPLGILQWNAQGIWKGNYVEDLSNVLFFAEDVFGGQFGIREGSVCTFDPETGLFERMSASISAWAEDLLSDYEFRSGYPLAHTWQVQNAPLTNGIRLLPKIPFVCGGKYEVENIFPLDEVKGMLFRASIANQIRNLPDGSQIVFDVSPPMT